MISFILSCCAAWIIFELLSQLFTRCPGKIREGDFIKEIDGQLYLVREVEQRNTAPVQRPPGKPDLRLAK